MSSAPTPIKRKEGPSDTPDVAKPVSEVRSTWSGDEPEEFGVHDDGEVIEIDLDSFTGGVVARARAKSMSPPHTTYRSPGSIFQHIVPTQIASDKER